MSGAFSRARALILAGMKEKCPLIVALEGGAATGKSTLAGELAREFSAPVIAMDDFFLPPALRTAERLSQPGGNIDAERFQKEVAAPLRAGVPFSYSVYDCHADRISGEKPVPRAPVILVEGVYSLHPDYQDIYGLRLFLRTSPEEQDARLRARGDWLYEKFQRIWLPLEKEYFSALHPEKICDAVLDT